jgi:hypothetical protein
MEERHDLHDFLISAQRDMQEEYERILKRTLEDPGTAGDQGEENWATLLRKWLPSYFHIVTKGRILCDNGYASPQIDVLVLHPSYPKVLLDKKLYLSGGVAAAFECKITLKSAHVKKAVETAANIRKNLPKYEGTPYKELNSKIIYGLLAHSHSWIGVNSKPLVNIENSLLKADQAYVEHPIQQLDFVTVSDLATWYASKILCNNPKFTSDDCSLKELFRNGSVMSIYICEAIGDEQHQEFFSPISVLLAGLFSKLSWIFNDMRELEAYFRQVKMIGSGKGRMRYWPITIYSEGIRNRIFNGQGSNNLEFDEWRWRF